MRSPSLVAVLTILAVPLFAEQTDHSGWHFDAVTPGHLSNAAGPNAADINALNDLLAKMLECWNTRDVDGFLSAFWNSPQLLVVLENDQYQGWEALSAAYKRGSRDPDAMGIIQSTRLQIKITQPGLALVQDSWTIRYVNKDSQVVGASTMTVQKLDGAWKIISSSSRYISTTSRGWEYDSIAPERATTPSSDQADIQAINTLLTNMDNRWNTHDVDGYMSAFWNSPELLVVVEEEQYQGWETLYKAYKSGFPDPNTMGTSEASRIQIKLLRPDFAVASNWWSVSYPNSKVHVVGNTMMDLQKFSDGWKIIVAHSSFAEP
jgi:ketosteroid isomerase-like protein